MKRILFLACLLAGGHLFAQNELPISVKVLDVYPQRPAEAYTQAAALNKTQATFEVTDSVAFKLCRQRINDNAVNLETLLGVARVQYPTTQRGYAAGTGGSVTAGGAYVSGFYSLQNFNNSFINANALKNSTVDQAFVKEIIFPSLGGVANYRAVKVGTPDPLYIRFYGVGGQFAAVSQTIPSTSNQINLPASRGINLNQVYGQVNFTVDDLLLIQNEQHRILLDNPIQVPDSFWVYVQVDSTAGTMDDTLAPGLLEAQLLLLRNPPNPLINDTMVCGADFRSAYQLRESNGALSGVPIRIPTLQVGGGVNATFPYNFLNTNIALYLVYEYDPPVSRTERKAIGQGSFALYSPYPNPAHTKLNLKYELAYTGGVTIRVMNNQLQTVTEVNLPNQPAGSYNYDLNTSDYAAGSYYVQMFHDGNVITQKVQVVR